MGPERVLAARQRLRIRELRIQELLEQFPPNSASELSEEMVTELIECEELRNELEFLCGDQPDAEEPDAFACASRKPRPPRTPGVIRLREPGGFPE